MNKKDAFIAAIYLCIGIGATLIIQESIDGYRTIETRKFQKAYNEGYADGLKEADVFWKNYIKEGQ